ncbi:MAG: enoyl-CoA hydratase/isomerase family protein [Burkholderiales bacterium]|nr:enoyl-CoA hydratase/isomerase family protein [Burkholderiales bacterium]
MTRTTVPLQTGKILAEVEEGIGWLTINQPERRNAVSLEMWQGLADAMAAFEADDAVRVVVLRGAGGVSFAAGADITEFEQQRADAQQKARYGEIAARGQKALARSSKPLLALVQGFCIGGGLAIALNADLRFATPGSRFGIPAARLGLGYEYAGVATLARLVGPSTAKDMLFSARQLGADEALRVGLVNAVVDDTEIEAHVRDYAARVAANAPLTVQAAKAALRVFERYADSAGAAEIATLVDRCFDSEDYREGRRAFLEKRTPRFQGR